MNSRARVCFCAACLYMAARTQATATPRCARRRPPAPRLTAPTLPGRPPCASSRPTRPPPMLRRLRFALVPPPQPE